MLAIRKLGLIGGPSWESTAIYCRHLNELTRERLGGLHSARPLLWSFDVADVAECQHAGDWAGATGLLVDAPGAWSAAPRHWCSAPTPCTLAPTA